MREPWQGIEVTRAGSLGSIGSVGVCPSFPFELWRARRDVTVIHEPNPLALVSDCVSAQSGPLVVWFHSEVIRPRWKYRLLYRPFLRRVLTRASRIVVSSPNAGGACRGAPGLSQQVRGHSVRDRHREAAADA